MSAIENFAALSAQEQREFAEALVKTINSENIFSSDVNFEIVGIEAYDFDGSLLIEVSQTNPIEVVREATWTAESEEGADSDPGSDAEYVDSIYNDAKKAFKTAETVIDGYKVSIDIADVNELETVEVKPVDITHEDSGIGTYEYGGARGYDSHPYVEVGGFITKACDIAFAFVIEPVNEAAEEPTEESAAEPVVEEE